MPFGKILTFSGCSLAVLAALVFSAGAQAQIETTNLVTTRLTKPIDNGARVTLRGTVHPLARSGNDRGAAPDGLPLERLQILLKRSDAQESALQQAIAEMHTPGSTSYHQWLTPAQFGQQYGPSDADINTIESWLRSQGFTIGALSPGHEVLEVSGTVANFRNAFHADIHEYQVNGERHFANATDPQIPEALAPVFGGFAALNNFHLKSHAKGLGHATYNPATHGGSHQNSPDWTVTDGSGVDYVLAPSDYAAQYDIPNGLCPTSPTNLCPTVTSTKNGSGQTIAIINDSNINVYMVNRFRTLFGLPANPPQVIVDGNDPGVDGINNPDGPNGASVEAYLDVVGAGAVAPAATVDLVVAADSNLEDGLDLALERAVYSNLAPVMSVSFGACEAALGTNGNLFLNSLYEQAAAQGITVMISTGDSGSAGCDNSDSQDYAVNGLAVSGFASSPYVVAVGGTDFYYSAYNQGSTALANQVALFWNPTPSNTTATTSIKAVVPEQPWNDSQYGLNVFNGYALNGQTSISGGSGGPSTCASSTTSGTTVTCTPYPKPSWQVATGVPSDSARDIPDVSLFAANGLNGSYYPICATDGDCQPASAGGEVQIFGVGGTSASSPAFAGIMALVNQQYGRQGQADFVLYPLAAQFPAAFHDVAAGTNTVPCFEGPSTPSPNCIAVTSPITTASGAIEGELGSGTTASYNAVTGYDLASGLGTVDANVLLADWNQVTLKTTTTTLTPSSTSFTHGTNVTVSGSVTGTTTPTGAVTLLTDNTDMAQQSQAFFALNNGSFTSPSINYLPGGTYNVWGAYGGDGVNGASSSSKTKITVAPEASSIFFIMTAIVNGGVGIVTSPSSPNYTAGTIAYGYALSLIGLPTPSSQYSSYVACSTVGGTCPVFSPPTGTVTFSDNGNVINVAVLNTEGDAEFTSPFSVGTHQLTANYSGDSSYNSSSGGTTQTFTIAKSTPTMGAGTSNEDSGGVISGGQQAVLDVFAENAINATSPVVAPTGTVTVTATGVAGCSSMNGAVTLKPVFAANVGSYGVGEVIIPANTITGACSVTLAYSGDGNYNTASGTSMLQFAAAGAQLPSTTTATASASSTSPSAAVNITTVVAGKSGNPAPTGTVTIYASTLNVGSFTLAASTGTSVTTVTALNTETLLQGNNLISLQYSGDTNYLPSVATLNVVNGQSDFSIIPTTTTVVMPASNLATDTINLASNFGFAEAISLTCSAPTGVACSFTPSSVTLTSGGTGSTSLSLNANGVTATGNYNVLVTATDPTGFYIHTLSIMADVTSLPVTGFGLTNSGTITLATQGATGTGTITVTPSGNFTGSVALTCAVTTTPSSPTKPVTCGVSSPVSITGTAAGTATLTINSSSSALYDIPLEKYFGVGGGALAMLFFLGIPRRRRSWRGLFALLLLAGAMTLGASGCSSGSSSSGGSTVTPPSTGSSTGTTLGTYVVTVTGTSGSTTASTAVTIIVN